MRDTPTTPYQTALARLHDYLLACSVALSPFDETCEVESKVCGTKADTLAGLMDRLVEFADAAVRYADDGGIVRPPLLADMAAEMRSAMDPIVRAFENRAEETRYVTREIEACDGSGVVLESEAFE
jgi:hypothetical protein